MEQKRSRESFLDRVRLDTIAGLVGRAEYWQWSSPWRLPRENEKSSEILSQWPMGGEDGIQFVNEPERESELEGCDEFEPDNSDNLPVQAAHSAPMRHWVFGAAVVAVWLALWEFIVRSWPGGHKFFSPPSTFLILFFKSLFVTGELRPHLSATIQRLLVGMIIGGVPALWIGRAMGRSRPLAFVGDPLPRRWVSSRCFPSYRHLLFCSA